MNIRQVIADAIELADEHAPNGEVLESFRDRRALYVMEAIEKATGVALVETRVDPAFVLDMPEPRRGPMFG